MPTPDIKYMNERLDFISSTIREAYSLYCYLSELDEVTQQQYKGLSDLYTTADTAIRDYYKYLKEVDIDPKESYLTRMLEKEHSGDMLYEVEDFLYSYKPT